MDKVCNSHAVSGVAIVLIFMVFPLKGWADQTHIQLDFQRSSGASSCLSEMDLRVGLGALLSYDPFKKQADQTYYVQIHSRDNGSGYRAELSIGRPGQSARRMQKLVTSADDCGGLGEATILAIAVAIDPSVGLARGGSDVSNQENNEAPGELARYRVRLAKSAAKVGVFQELLAEARKESTKQEADTSVRILGGGGVSSGLLPSASVFSSVGLSSRFGWFSVQVDGRLDFPVEQTVGAGSFESLAFLGETAICGNYEPMFGCGVFASGVLHQQGVALERESATTNPFIGSGARFGTDLELTERIGLRFQAELLVSFIRVDTTIGDDVVWESPPISGNAGVTAFWQFN